MKWFIKETNSNQALEVRDKHINGTFTLAAPAFLPFEALNALRYSGLYTPPELKKAATALSSYGLSLYPLEGEYAQLSVEVADANDITMYDSSYVALALKLDTRFLTADRQLLRKLRGKYARAAFDISKARLLPMG